MKKFLNYALYTGLLVAALMFTSCQTEEVGGSMNDEAETLMAGSNTVKLVEHTVSNDGSFDNIVDGSSCFDVRFPYTVSVNGLEITINSHEDLALIEELFDAVDDDEDILDIFFPITVILADYTEITINGKEDLRELAEKCIEGGGDDDIECIDVIYPIDLFTFNPESVQTGTVTVNSDKELRRFFAGLGETDLISFNFPISFEMYDGTKVTVNTNAELADAIERAKNACDEDDDDDYNDDDFSKERLDALLVECPWSIKEVERDNQNQTDQYREYLMNFSEDGKVTVIDRMGNSLTGSWSTRVADWKVLLKLEFDVLVDFNLEWFVYELEKDMIKLYQEGGNKIIMNSVCDVVDQEPDTLREILRECHWVIKKVKVDGEEIRRLLGYEFEFTAEGVTLSNGETTSQGSWEITTNEQGRLVMAITMGEEPGVSFEWPLSHLRNDRLKFEIPGTDYELILQRVCNNSADDGDVMEIRNVMMGGSWMIAKYAKGDMDSTSNYANHTFDFGAEHRMSVTTGDTGPTYPGLWRVLRNSDGKLKVYLNLGEEGPFEDLTDDWDFVSINEGRIELKDIDGEGTITTLVFEK